MNKSNTNLFYRILKEIRDSEVNSLRIIAKTLEIPEVLLKIIVQSLIKKGYINKINESKFEKKNILTCKFCPFANQCPERIPKIFYEISLNGKKILGEKMYNHA